jgi:hypothetical protein
LRTVDRSHPEVKELAERLEAAHQNIVHMINCYGENYEPRAVNHRPE